MISRVLILKTVDSGAPKTSALGWGMSKVKPLVTSI